MVSFTTFTLALAAISSTLAAPTANVVESAPQTIEDLPDFEIGGDTLARRQDYTQNYKTGGNVNFQPASNGYSVSFSGAQDFVVGRGWNKGANRWVTLNLFVWHLN